jgi:hypothetical protein
MSLTLLEGYSSAEDDEPAAGADPELSESGNSSAEEAGSDGDQASAPPKPASKPRRRSNPKGGNAGGGGDSSLPSALEAFADVSGSPDFLRHRVAEPEVATEALGVLDRRAKDGSKQPPPGKLF